MAYFWFILAGCLCFVTSKEIAKDYMEMKFDALVDRIEVLENSVQSQNRMIHSQQDKLAAMKETINTQAEELKKQHDSIAQLQDTTNKRRFDVIRLERRVKMFESKIPVQRISTSVDAPPAGLDNYPIDYINNENSTESKEKEWTIKSNSGISNKHQQSGNSEAKQDRFVNKTAIQRASIIKDDVRRLLAPVPATHIAFSAYLDKTVAHLGINHIIPFDKVLLNEGNAFNTHTGIFHCPQSGVYLFSFNIESNNYGVIAAKLVVDGKNQIDAVAGGNDNVYTTGGVTAIVPVLSGQSVWVATYRINDVTLFNADVMHYTSFSGALLF